MCRLFSVQAHVHPLSSGRFHCRPCLTILFNIRDEPGDRCLSIGLILWHWNFMSRATSTAQGQILPEEDRNGILPTWEEERLPQAGILYSGQAPCVVSCHEQLTSNSRRNSQTASSEIAVYRKGVIVMNDLPTICWSYSLHGGHASNSGLDTI